MANQSSKLNSLSVFIPCFNEEENLVSLVHSLQSILPKVAQHYEVILINDGSHDHTGEIADRLAISDTHLRVIHHPTNLGYGSSLRSGFSAAKYEWTFFTDGDLQFDVTELKKLIPFTSKYQVVIGYREKRAEGGMRVFNANLFKLYINLLFRLHVKDIDCAFKLIKSDLIHQIAFISTGATINAELLYRLKKMHQPFKQISVHHYPRANGKPTGNNPRVVLRAGIESIKIYCALKFGWKIA
jgi:glycosyltransferase involved in cell wall biosynthesis